MRGEDADGDGRGDHEAALNIDKNRSQFAVCFWVKSRQPTLNQSIPSLSVKRSAFSLVVCKTWTCIPKSTAVSLHYF